MLWSMWFCDQGTASVKFNRPSTTPFAQQTMKSVQLLGMEIQGIFSNTCLFYSILASQICPDPKVINVFFWVIWSKRLPPLSSVFVNRSSTLPPFVEHVLTLIACPSCVCASKFVWGLFWIGRWFSHPPALLVCCSCAWDWATWWPTLQRAVLRCPGIAIVSEGGLAIFREYQNIRDRCVVFSLCWHNDATA